MEKKLEGIIESLSQLTILEVKELVDALKEQWGVSDAVAVAAPAAGPAAEAVEEQTEFDVFLESAPANKLKAIQELRKFNKDLSLTDAKALIEKAPTVLLSALSKADAEAAKKSFEDSGVTVVLK
ncbi:MAG: 50S ribosomal protein L7/L12 [Alphaproteobacteria bacterium]|nr:50S ribosomal protein L7/L12 [Alphaproteobacteria bacterium]